MKIDFQQFAHTVRVLCPDVGAMVHNANGRIDVWHHSQPLPIHVMSNATNDVLNETLSGWRIAEAVHTAINQQRRESDVSNTNKPKVVCLTGSTRFRAEYQAVARAETLAGNIVLGPFIDTSGPDHGEVTEEVKRQLDELHLRKIDISDEVVVINVGGYIGDSTRDEIAYATSIGKPIRYIEDQPMTVTVCPHCQQGIGPMVVLTNKAVLVQEDHWITPDIIEGLELAVSVAEGESTPVQQRRLTEAHEWLERVKAL